MLESHRPDSGWKPIEMLSHESENLVIQCFLIDLELPERVVVGDLTVNPVTVKMQIVHQDLWKFSPLLMRLATHNLKRLEELSGGDNLLLDEQIAEFSFRFSCLRGRCHGYSLFRKSITVSALFLTVACRSCFGSILIEAVSDERSVRNTIETMTTIETPTSMTFTRFFIAYRFSIS